jgi:hypothetical protein
MHKDAFESFVFAVALAVGLDSGISSNVGPLRCV